MEELPQLFATGAPVGCWLCVAAIGVAEVTAVASVGASERSCETDGLTIALFSDLTATGL